MVIKRCENWPIILSDYLLENKDKPFSWGDNDCIYFSFKFVEKITGVNFYKEYPSYNTEKEALDIIKNNGGMIKMISNALGVPSRNMLIAKRGNVVLAKDPYAICGIVDDSGQYAVFVTECGTKRISLNKCIMHWEF